MEFSLIGLCSRTSYNLACAVSFLPEHFFDASFLFLPWILRAVNFFRPFEFAMWFVAESLMSCLLQVS